MIFTDCPTCDHPQVFGWESGDPGGHFPSKCEKCGKVMWVEATSMGGSTRSHDEFLREIAKPEDLEELERARREAKDLSAIEGFEEDES